MYIGTSLLRGVSVNSIKNQFKRILLGDAPLTKFHFAYSKPKSNNYSGIELNFHVKPNSKPATNVHILTGDPGSFLVVFRVHSRSLHTPGCVLKNHYCQVQVPTLPEDNQYVSLWNVHA